MSEGQALDRVRRLRLTDVLAVLDRRPPVPSPVLSPVPDGSGAGARTDAGIAAALDRARRSGHPPRVVDALAHVLDGLDADVLRYVLDPLRRTTARDRPVEQVSLGPVHAHQVDGTTCGSAALGLLAAAGDPVLALWLVTGATPGSSHGTAAARGPEEPVDRWRHLQQTLKRRTTRHALGPIPWPGALGTPPWGAARVARYADVRYAHRVVGPPQGDAVLTTALRAAARGVPVPLFTGGDLSGGPAAAVPRHVVLLTRADAAPDAVPDDAPEVRPGDRERPSTSCDVYEPSSGTLHRIDAAHLAHGAYHPGVRRALGGWPHVVWALLPTAPPGVLPSVLPRVGDHPPTA
ncbi:hypothetical protein [Cellulosimicrobium marinum]|uniref:hypothetical protein n=1 Tax=Cellulosimicrobium marinum TaxID=1638992 RepID=UPI001E31D76E|nr:hypothetical protein [Cellulosimicrobium marinum]MCB7136486.1 hypothetical protein [Cellulosimicrobium marinum]